MEFVNMPEDVELYGYLSESDILAEMSTKKCKADSDQDNDTDELKHPPISSKDAVEYLNKLRSSALYKIENEIDRARYSY